MNKTITPGEGYGDVKFGMSREKVEALLGPPTEIEEMEDDSIVFWHYDELLLSLTFDGTEGWRLSSMVAGDLGMSIFNSDIDDLTKHDLTNLLKFNAVKNLGFEEEEVDGVKLHTIEADDIEMIFWFEEDELTEIQWGPYFTDEQTISWPVES